MLDPRIELANMLYEMKEKLNEIEMKLWTIPHHEEPVAEYEAVFTAPAEGDYLHPATPTHPAPEGFSETAYWDQVCQAWMEPTQYEWDEHNYCDNANADVSYDAVESTWTEGNDWSNDFASEWYDFSEGNVVVDTAEVSTEEFVAPEGDDFVAPEPVLDADGFLVEDAPMPTDMPVEDMPMETAPMEAPVTHDENGNPIV